MTEYDDDDIPTLSSETMDILKEFLQESSERQLKLTELSEQKTPGDILSLNFDEDWQKSQFWYDDKTADSLSKALVKVAGSNGSIGLISCPTLYRHLKCLAPSCKVTLLEYDKRFSIYEEDYIFYDYNSPLDIPRALASQFDVVMLDPPFLSEECLTKSAVTAKFIAKDKIILCSGAVMETLAKRLLNMQKCTFEPRHKNNLANEFCCYANFDFDSVL